MMLSYARTWWRGLAHRERMMVVFAVAVVAIGLLYTIGIEPAWKTRSSIATELPRLQAELVQLQALLAEVRVLRGRNSGKQTRESLRAAVEKSMLRADMVSEVINKEGDAVSVRARNVSASKWFEWLESFVREARVQVVASRVERVSAGRVNASVSFDTALAK